MLCYGQTFDCFGGLITYATGQAGPVGPGGPHQQRATVSRSGSTVTATVTNGAVYAIGEPMAVTGTGTALDWSNTVCLSNLAQTQVGGLLITNIVGNTLTLSSPTSGTISATAGTIKPLRWYVATVGTHVRIFDPLDHWLFSQQVVQASAASIAKYGSNACNTAKDEFIAWNTLGNGAGSGFNSTGQSNSNNNYYQGSGACPSNPGIPYIIENFISSYYSDNLIQNTWTGVSQPGKDMNWATDSNYVCQGISRASLDFFDARFEQFALGWFNGSNDFPNFRKSAWFIGADHQDSGVGGAAPTNSTWNFNTAPTGKNDCHQGLLVLATSPHQTMSGNVLYGGTPNGPNAFPGSGFYLYPDAKVYMKTSAATNYYGESSTSTPQSNCNPLISTQICPLQDWLTNRYGTIAALNTAWGTSYTTFGSSETQVTSEAFGTGTGTSTTLTHSMAHGNISPTSIQILVNGVVVGGDCPTTATGCPTVSGSGTMTGVNITGGTCNYSTGASCTITANFTNGAPVTVNYTYNGWGSPTTGTGLMDEDGRHMGANGVCPFTPPTFQNNHLYNVGDEISVSGSWQYATSASSPSQASGTPAWSATTGKTTFSGGVKFTSLGAPVCGSGGTYTGTLPNATMGADMDAFVEYIAAAYMSSLKTALNTAAPDLLNWGPDQLGVWQTPPNQNVLLAANTYVDVAMGDLWDFDQDGAGPAKYDFFTHYYSGPLSNYQAPTASQSAFTCNGNVPCFTTQQQRGQWWNTLTNYWLRQVGHDGLRHGAAIQWTSNVDGLQSSSFGFETAAYNPYNTHDDVTASVSCLFNAFTCGSESSASWNGSDGITDANCGACIAKATRTWAAAPIDRQIAYPCASAGPPSYPCSNPGTAVIQTPNSPPFSGATGYNQAAYDLVMNPRWLDVYLRTTDSTMIDGHSPSSTPTGGNYDRIISCTGRSESTACQNATLYLQEAFYNGCPYMMGIKFVGGLPKVVAPLPAHVGTNTPSPCGTAEASFIDPLTYYMASGTDPKIYKLVYAWDGTVGDSITLSSQTVIADLGVVCPLPNGTSFNAQYVQEPFPSALDNQFTLGMSPIIGLSQGTDTVSVTNGLTGFTLTGTYSMATDGSLLNAQIVIGGVTYTIASVTNGTTGVLSAPYAGSTASGVSVSIPSGQNTVVYIALVQISPAGCQLWNTYTGQITASGALSGGSISSSCLGMRQHDGFSMQDGLNMENSGASTGTNCGSTYNFWGLTTLNNYPCTATIPNTQSACNGHEAPGYHNEALINNPYMESFSPTIATGGLVTPIGQYPAQTPLNCENHISWVNATSGDTQPIIDGTANNNFSTSGTSSTYTNPYFNENFSVAQNAQTARFGHNFILGPGNSAGCGTSNVGPFDSLFRAQNGIGSVSPDGKIFAFNTSDLGTFGNGACQTTNNCTDVDGQIRAEIIDVALDLYVPVAVTSGASF